jgi:hypothetical protein
VALCRKPSIWFATALLLASSSIASAQPKPDRVDNLRDMFTRLESCWQPPPPSRANPVDITVIFSFDRAGNIFGRPKITYESDQATDNDRLLYRIAVMEALQRCTPRAWPAQPPADLLRSCSVIENLYPNRQRREHG